VRWSDLPKPLKNRHPEQQNFSNSCTKGKGEKNICLSTFPSRLSVLAVICPLALFPAPNLRGSTLCQPDGWSGVTQRCGSLITCHLIPGSPVWHSSAWAKSTACRHWSRYVDWRAGHDLLTFCCILRIKRIVGYVKKLYFTAVLIT